ncbi:MAG: OmpA family protein [Cryomorphaceae bacterium]|nr:OmpA family protein [Cryomorphaceae bacterium]
MTIKRLSFTLFPMMFFCLITTTAVNAQSGLEETDGNESVSKEMARANEAFEYNEYHSAVTLYKKAFTRTRSKKEKVEITFLMAECYRMMDDWKSAASQYSRAIKLDYGDPIVYLRHAEMLKMLGEYEDAIVEYQKYVDRKPDDPRGKMGIESVKMAKKWKENPSRYLVENMSDLNTKQNEFAITYGGKPAMNDELYFVSDRDDATGKQTDGWTGDGFTDIFVTKAERKKKTRTRGKSDGAEEEMSWSIPMPIEGEVINTKHHEGPLAFDSRRRTMYFTRCEKQKNNKLGCKIFKADKRGQGWGEPEMQLLTPDSATSVGHPCLSPDDEILYFASDLEDGYGGRDLYMTTYNRRERSWEKPKNLGPKVNTLGSELYPYVHLDGYLYFASDGHPGMGGLDIFRIKLDDNGMPEGEVENMQFPINTNANDFAIVFDGDEAEKGFLSSDRDEGRGGFDIYSVTLAPLVFEIEGRLYSSKDKKPINTGTVKLDGGGSSYTVVTDKSGYYKFTLDQVREDVTYKLSFEKKQFLAGQASATTVGIPFDAFEFVPDERHYLHVIKVDKEIEPIEVPIVLPNVLFTTAQWDLRPESKVALDTVVEILNNNPTLVVELRSHTDYRDTDERNMVLSQKRAQSCVDYLIEKGIPKDRLVAKGRGEEEPFTIPENYDGFGHQYFKAGTVLTEQYIRKQKAEIQEVANQINRRTDFKVLHDNYVPTKVVKTESGEEKKVEIKPIIHTVEGRESFAAIAKQYNIDIRTLRDLNGGLRGVRPFEGLELKVVPEADYSDWERTRYRVQMGDNLSKIAKEHDLKAKELRDLNEGIKDADISPGMIIKIAY